MPTLTEREAERILETLQLIRLESRKPKQRQSNRDNPKITTQKQMKKQTPYDYMMQALERNRKRGTSPRIDNGDLEHDIQCSCVKWFRTQYPQLSNLLFAVPNGGFRNKATAVKMKAEGVIPGVSDLILLHKSGDYGALLIEMKTNKGRQSENQKAWQAHVIEFGYKYVVCRSLEDFIKEIKDYLK